jgi:hypothetical protein
LKGLLLLLQILLNDLKFVVDVVVRTVQLSQGAMSFVDFALHFRNKKIFNQTYN